MSGALELQTPRVYEADHSLHVLDDSFNREKTELPLVVEFVAQPQIEIDINLTDSHKPERPVFRQKRAFRPLNQSTK